MLDGPSAAAKVRAIGTAFAAIGVSAVDTRMPAVGSASDTYAWDLFVAEHLFGLADARRALARKNAVRMGVLFDHHQRPRPIGTRAVVYAGEVVCVGVEVDAGAHGFPRHKFSAVLIASDGSLHGG